MARPIGRIDNGWIIEKLEVSDRLYERIKSSNLFHSYMEGEDEKWFKIKVYRKYYEYLTKDLIVMFEFYKKDDLIKRILIMSLNQNLINNIKTYLN